MSFHASRKFPSYGPKPDEESELILRAQPLNTESRRASGGCDLGGTQASFRSQDVVRLSFSAQAVRSDFFRSDLEEMKFFQWNLVPIRETVNLPEVHAGQ